MIRFFSHLFPKAVTVLMLEDIKLILHFDCSLNLSYSAVCKNIYFITLLFQAYSMVETKNCFCDRATCEKPD